VRTTFQTRGTVDLRSTLAPLRHGISDPTIAMGPGGAALGLRTSGGPALLRLRATDGSIEATAWGPGSKEALDVAPELCGVADVPPARLGPNPSINQLHRQNPGLRMCRTNDVMRTLIPSILEQKVTTDEAHLAYSQIVRRFSEPAPGPGNIYLPPDPAVLAALPYFTLHRFGVERKRARTIHSVASRAAAIRRISFHHSVRENLLSLPGIGPWTAALVMQAAFGDPDAILVGDYHMPNIVGWYFERTQRSDDARMMELLQPFEGQRARVQRLIAASGVRPSARGSKRPLRSIAAI
jgi:3-methyladenine DNA glycosylase/8-oxoguanine DNA glycosylase